MTMIFAWILRVLVLLFLFRVIVRLLTSGVRTAPQGPRPSPGPPATPGGTLVRDPQCGTSLLESRAIALTHGREHVFFCSAACRDTWAAAHYN